MANPLFMGGPTAQPVDSADTGYIEATYDPATKTFYGDAGGSIGWGPITNQGEIDKLKQKNKDKLVKIESDHTVACLLYTSPSPRDQRGSRMPSSA